MVESYCENASDCHMTFSLNNLHKLAISVLLNEKQSIDNQKSKDIRNLSWLMEWND